MLKARTKTLNLLVFFFTACVQNIDLRADSFVTPVHSSDLHADSVETKDLLSQISSKALIAQADSTTTFFKKKARFSAQKFWFDTKKAKWKLAATTIPFFLYPYFQSFQNNESYLRNGCENLKFFATKPGFLMPWNYVSAAFAYPSAFYDYACKAKNKIPSFLSNDLSDWTGNFGDDLDQSMHEVLIEKAKSMAKNTGIQPGKPKAMFYCMDQEYFSDGSSQDIRNNYGANSDRYKPGWMDSIGSFLKSSFNAIKKFPAFKPDPSDKCQNIKSKFGIEEISDTMLMLIPAYLGVAVAFWKGSKIIGREMAIAKATFVNGKGATAKTDTAIEKECRKIVFWSYLNGEFELSKKSIALAVSDNVFYLTKKFLSRPTHTFMYGPPGCGKTALVTYLAKKLDYGFMNIPTEALKSPAGKFMPDKKKNLEAIFQVADDYIKITNKPIIVFFDEGQELIKKDNEISQSFKSLMSGSTTSKNIESGKVIVILATNYPEEVEEAAIRDGRLGNKIEVKIPDNQQRTDIYAVYLAKNRDHIDYNNISARDLAELSQGYTGASIEAMVNELVAVGRTQGKIVTMSDIIEEITTRKHGSFCERLVLQPNLKQHASFHEAGKSLVIRDLNRNDILKTLSISIKPRQDFVSNTIFATEYDIATDTQKDLNDKLVALVAGQIAEELLFGPSQFAATLSADMHQAMFLVEKMICQYGMTSRPGIVEKGSEASYQEMGKLLDEAKSTAREILTRREKDLHSLAELLLEKETIFTKDIDNLFNQDTSLFQEAAVA